MNAGNVGPVLVSHRSAALEALLGKAETVDRIESSERHSNGSESKWMAGRYRQVCELRSGLRARASEAAAAC